MSGVNKEFLSIRGTVNSLYPAEIKSKPELGLPK